MPLPETSPGVLTPFLESANVGKENFHKKSNMWQDMQYVKILV